MAAERKDRPFFSIKALPEGSSAQTLDLTDKIISFEFIDEESKADKLSLKIKNWDMSEFDNPIWKKGTILEATWGYPGRVAPTRRAVVQEIKGNRIAAVVAHGMTMSMHKVKRCRVWKNKTMAEIATEIAASYGVEFGVAGGTTEGAIKTDPKLDRKVAHRVQASQTDAAFLAALAKRHGLQFYVDSLGLHFKPRNLQQAPVREYQWFNGEGDFIDFDVDNNIVGRAGAVTKKGMDPLHKKTLKHTADNDNTKRDGLASVIEIVSPRTGARHLQKRAAEEHTEHSTETTQQGIQSHAEGKFKDTQQTTVRLSFTLVGDPDVLAKRVVIFSGLGKRLSGRYYINSATHTIDNGGYRVTGKSHSDGTGGYGKDNAGSSANLNKKDAVDADKLEEIEKYDPRTGSKHVELRKRGEEQSG